LQDDRPCHEASYRLPVTNRRLLLLAFAAFIALAMPGAAQGVAWPAIADDLGRGIGDLGLLLFVSIAGYFTSSLARHGIARRIGTGATLVASSVIGTVGLVGFAAAQSWWQMLAATAIVGLWGGTIDTALNAHVALHHGTRAMGMLHASFGIGATLSPLVISRLLAVDLTWRWAFVGFAAAQAIVGVALWRTLGEWAAPEATAQQQAPWRPLLRVVVPLLVGILFITGLEMSAGQWAASLLSIGRGLETATAAAIVAAYWGCFTAGRLVMGAAGHLTSPQRLVHWGSATTVVGAAAFWWSPEPWLGAAGLLIIGVGLAPLFPVFMLITPSLVGTQRASQAVGFQLAAANVGIAAIPAGLGFPVNRWGVESIPPLLVIIAILLAVSAAITTRAISADR
jgi:fucose permease